ncbi:hypothetical protein BS47DRAFT_1488419 [Hydnum rufescens UP504]|uniref:Acyl-protein thioesterase 1 n=1 Tax=Hydnum rufescens UP504 TaxID=1448309 RepID=A0A9P6AP27_9AGAM|nr:hypothetical protein BS47DRAFT_1488419 [Hydnum rufescens UP504]
MRFDVSVFGTVSPRTEDLTTKVKGKGCESLQLWTHGQAYDGGADQTYCGMLQKDGIRHFLGIVPSSVDPVSLKHTTLKGLTSLTLDLSGQALGKENGKMWLPIATELSERLPHVKFILPNANARPITAWGGAVFPAWLVFSRTGLEEAHISIRRRLFDTRTESKIAGGIAPHRIILGGFSQGGVATLLTALTTEHHIGGVSCLSGWLALRAKIHRLALHAVSMKMYLLAHGTLDTVVSMALFSESCQVMTDKQKLSIPPRDIGDGPRPGLATHIYEGMEHASDPRETLDLLYCGG